MDPVTIALSVGAFYLGRYVSKALGLSDMVGKAVYGNLIESPKSEWYGEYVLNAIDKGDFKKVQNFFMRGANEHSQGESMNYYLRGYYHEDEFKQLMLKRALHGGHTQIVNYLVDDQRVMEEPGKNKDFGDLKDFMLAAVAGGKVENLDKVLLHAKHQVVRGLYSNGFLLEAMQWGPHCVRQDIEHGRAEAGVVQATLAKIDQEIQVVGAGRAFDEVAPLPEIFRPRDERGLGLAFAARDADDMRVSPFNNGVALRDVVTLCMENNWVTTAKEVTRVVKENKSFGFSMDDLLNTLPPGTPAAEVVRAAAEASSLQSFSFGAKARMQEFFRAQSGTVPVERKKASVEYG